MQQKWFLLVNPIAGNGKGKKHWKSIQQILNNMGIAYDFAISKQAGDITKLTLKAVEDGYKKFVAVGGDGTVNEVIQGLFSQQTIPTTELTFAIIPVGTGNDWIRTHNIPSNYKKAILLIKAGKKILHDVGQVDYSTQNNISKRHHFINVAGMGYDAFVTRASNEKSYWNKSQWYYYYLILSCSLKYKPTKAKVTFDGQEMEGEFYSLAMGICKYNGGGAQFVPHADPSDGYFALTLFKDISLWEVAWNSPKFYNGKIVEHHKVHTFKAKHIKIEAIGEKPTLLEVDGEFLGDTPVEFTILPSAINVIVP